MTVTFRGKQVDPVSLWSEYVEFPANWQQGKDEEFGPRVECPNPKHDTHKRHFQVNLKRPLVHCFANCGISGTYENAIAMIEGVTHREARKRILKHSRIGKVEIRKKSAREEPSPESLEYERYLPQAAIEYLENRGITDASVAKWELGWGSDDLRIVIPAKDHHGRLRFLIRRAVKPKSEPKYLYPTNSERNRLVFGACHLDLGLVSSRGMVLVEGSIDTIVQHQNGLANTGGILGSKISGFQARIVAGLRPPCIFTMFDADEAGITATISVARAIPRIPLYVCRYRKGKLDPAELTRRDAEKMISRAVPWYKFQAMIPKL